MAEAIVTAPMAKAMREFRAAGAKYREISNLFCLNQSVVMYHCNDAHAIKQRYNWRRSKQRMLADPERRKAYVAYQRERRRIRRQRELLKSKGDSNGR